MPNTPLARTGDILVSSLPDNAVDLQFAQLSNGHVVATWSYVNTYRVAARIFTQDGIPVGDAFMVHDHYGYSQSRPHIAALADGGFSIVHRTAFEWNRPSYLWINHFDADGASRGPGHHVNVDAQPFGLYTSGWPGPATASISALDDGRSVVVWATANDDRADGSATAIYAQIIGVDGQPEGGNFLVNTATDGYQTGPSIITLANGGFVIAWDGWSTNSAGSAALGVYAQVFSASAQPLGGEITLNTHIGGNQAQPILTALAGGGFVAVWESNNQVTGNSGWDIFGQIFSASGARIGPEFLVNTTTARNQMDAVVTSLRDGGFLVVWEANPIWAGTGWQVQILGQRYTADGIAAGQEFRLNETDIPTWTSNSPEVIGTHDGGFLVAFVRPGEGGYEVVMRDFTVPSMTGGPGDDLLHGTGANDTVFGEAAHDTIYGHDGADWLYGGAGDDVLDGGAGADRLYGGAGNDRLTGATGKDRLYGGAGNDTLSGGKGDDQIWGATGDDLLRGGAGNDTLTPGLGADRLEGGAGADVFVWADIAESANDTTRDRVLDFEVGIDRVDISALSTGLHFVQRLTGVAGQVSYNAKASRLLVDIDGDGVADFSVQFSDGVVLGAADLIL